MAEFAFGSEVEFTKEFKRRRGEIWGAREWNMVQTDQKACLPNYQSPWLFERLQKHMVFLKEKKGNHVFVESFRLLTLLRRVVKR